MRDDFALLKIIFKRRTCYYYVTTFGFSETGQKFLDAMIIFRAKIVVILIMHKRKLIIKMYFKKKSTLRSDLRL
jgi:voltage-gated potassium channel Kch